MRSKLESAAFVEEGPGISNDAAKDKHFGARPHGLKTRPLRPSVDQRSWLPSIGLGIVDAASRTCFIAAPGDDASTCPERHPTVQFRRACGRYAPPAIGDRIVGAAVILLVAPAPNDELGTCPDGRAALRAGSVRVRHRAPFTGARIEKCS